ncbi:MAG: transketolase C-terminal domain-containing protein [Candidatus Peregrinibacteria bacterium]|nr:transketolase C-terminal domain-containing protein [Candidatus Peregrinibacteria bacterium]
MKNNSYKAFDDAMIRILKKHGNFMVFMGAFPKVFEPANFARFFHDRVFNFGLAEANLVTAAAGSTVRGKLPFVLGGASSLTGKALEQIKDMICYPNLNVKIIGFGSGLSTGQGGVGMHATSDIALMRSIPNMKVFCPADYYQAIKVFDFISEDFGPSYVRLFDSEIENIFDEKYELKAVDRVREYGDVLSRGVVAILSHGRLFSECLIAVKELEKNGKQCGLYNFSTIKPLDKKVVLEILARYKKIFIVEDHGVGGLYSAIAEILAEGIAGGNGMLAVLKKIGIDEKFVESAREEDLYKKYGLDWEGILKEIGI